MSRLARRVRDKHPMRSRAYPGDGTKGRRRGGALANLLLDGLDWELERWGHVFCRYADACNIYGRSQAAGERVLASVTTFLDCYQSCVAIGRRSRRLPWAKDRVLEITHRNRSVSFGRWVSDRNSFLTGWVTYYRSTGARRPLQELGHWVRRRLRCGWLKQRKRAKPIADFLHGLGVSRDRCWTTATSGNGWSRLAGTLTAQEAMSLGWFLDQGLADPLAISCFTNLTETARYGEYVRWRGGTGPRGPLPSDLYMAPRKSSRRN